MTDTFASRYQAISSRDPRYDGQFFTAVTSTGIYCRPSCPARTPKETNVVFFSSAAGAQAAGFRACRRCRPEASPGSPAWDVRADLVGRALRHINDGVVDAEGVSGLARRLAVSERHLHRQMVAEVGVGPLAFARMRRTQTAKLLLEATDLPVTRVGFAAGFSSIRQFNASVQEVFGCSPSAIRSRGRTAGEFGTGEIVVKLAYREPLAVGPLLAFFADRAVPGLEEAGGGLYRRALSLPNGVGVATVIPAGADGTVPVRLHLTSFNDLSVAVQRCRQMFDLDADPVAVDHALGADPLLNDLVAARPGLRVPGHVEGFELAVRAVLGQQVSVQGARTLAGRLVEHAGTPIETPVGAVTHLFPTADVLVDANLGGMGVTQQRVTAIHALAQAVTSGSLDLSYGADRPTVRSQLLALPGIGSWTADYIALRALGDPDAIPIGDLGLRKAWQALTGSSDDEFAAYTERWRPWRAYAALHLWCSGLAS